MTMSFRINRCGFTLIEMLTVLVIIAILIAVSIPAVTSLMKSGGLTAGVREVSNSLSLARQYAITKRTTTRVLFAYRGSSTNGVLLSNLVYVAYSIVATNRDATTSATSWPYISKWEHLPLGTIFLDNTPPITGYNLDNDFPKGNFQFPNTNSPSTASFAYIEFGPTGAASQSGTITLAEGYIDNTSIPRRPSTNNFANIAFDNLVGRIAIYR